MSLQKTKPSSSLINQKNQPIDSNQTAEQPLSLEALAWSEAEIKESHYRLKHLEDDWNAPEMDAYDQL